MTIIASTKTTGAMPDLAHAEHIMDVAIRKLRALRLQEEFQMERGRLELRQYKRQRRGTIPAQGSALGNA